MQALVTPEEEPASFMRPRPVSGNWRRSNVPEILDALASVIAARRAADPNESYVASLNAKGLNKILEKIGEEAVEVIIAAKDAELGDISNEEVINEVADLVFHTLVMLDRLGISHNDVLGVLASRQGLSGLEEKASRNQ